MNLDEQIVRRGRPPGTSVRQLEHVALRLFTDQGYDQTTVDQIAAGAGVSRRTFFRYFDSKASALWGDFDREIGALRGQLAAKADDQPIMDAVREAVLTVNHYRPEDVSELRARMNLIASVPELAASATIHYDAWERAISEFVARRMQQPADALIPRTVALATLASCRAAYEQWATRADADLTLYLDEALRALARGFSDQTG